MRLVRGIGERLLAFFFSFDIPLAFLFLWQSVFVCVSGCVPSKVPFVYVCVCAFFSPTLKSVIIKSLNIT